MNLKNGVFLAFVLVFLLMSLFGPRLVVTVGGSATIEVHPGQSIQEAINSAESEETIFVHAGNYSERVVVNKTVSLTGENKFNTTIDGGGAGTVINVTAPYVKITGLTVKNGGPGYGIYAHGTSYGNRISGNIVRSNSIGIWLNGSNSNILLDNNCSSNVFDGIFLKSSKNSILSGNVALNNEYGYWVEASSGNSISGNNASNNRNTGFWVTAASDNELSGNSVSKSPYGFWVVGSKNNVFSSNLISCGKDAYGITFINSDNNTVTGNTASNNFVGVRLNPDSSNNMVFHNNFINNNETLRGVLANSLDNGLEGNYWTDYNGTDDDQDGVGETPYVVNANNTDYHPLMGMFFCFNLDFEGETYHVFAVCNSTIFGFNWNNSARMVNFNITGPNGSTGFCRIMIPKILINYEPYVVFVGDGEAEAKLLPASNTTHAFLYFAYNLTTQKVTVISRSYYELLEKYGGVLTDLRSLNSTHNQLLNAHYDLNTIYETLLGNYTELRSDLDSLQADYNSLLELFDSRRRELENTRNLMYVFVAATILGAVVLLPFGAKYYRVSNEQKRIIEAYSPFEIASVLFKTDVERRRAKIGKFEEKYGVSIRPRNTLDEVFRSVETKKKVKR